MCVCVCVCVTTGDGAFGSSRGYPDPCLSPAGSVYQSTEAGRQAGGHGAVGGGVEELTEGVCQGWRCSSSAWSHKAIVGEQGR